ncbi:MAG TPA: sigma-70 family RNA polymerase sigma factor [Clostridia bacterium]|nr:sigma-70 family RNA polymerase sigma factor [Clostridia bacterium]
MDAVTDLLRRDPERALSQMLGAYTGLVYHAAAAVLGRSSHEEIEECVNDAFLVIYKSRDRLDFSQGSVKAYLCATARNLAINRLKKREGAQEVSLDEFVSSPSEQTESAALRNLEAEELVNAVLALGEPDSKIILYRYYFDLPSKQIAKLLGTQPNTIDQRLRRALGKLNRLSKGGNRNDE